MTEKPSKQMCAQCNGHYVVVAVLLLTAKPSNQLELAQTCLHFSVNCWCLSVCTVHACIHPFIRLSACLHSHEAVTGGLESTALAIVGSCGWSGHSMPAGCITVGPKSVSTGNGQPLACAAVLQPVPISCHFWGYKAPLSRTVKWRYNKWATCSPVPLQVALRTLSSASQKWWWWWWWWWCLWLRCMCACAVHWMLVV